MVINILNSKRSQSEVIGTILLVLLTISAAAILIGFIFPLVQKQISKSDCFDFAQKIEIKNSDFTCYNFSSKNITVQIGIDDIDRKKIDMIKALKIIINQEGFSESFEINNSEVSTSGRILMYNGTNSLSLPNKTGEQKTYRINNINTKPTSITIYPILSDGKSCSESNNQINEIKDC